jgi:hypothetical protein
MSEVVQLSMMEGESDVDSLAIRACGRYGEGVKLREEDSGSPYESVKN